MKPLNGHTIIDMIDNTKTGSILDGVNAVGYRTSKLMAPNMGRVYRSNIFTTGDILVFDNVGIDSYYDKFYIKNSSVFLVNNELIKPGVIVNSVPFNQESIKGFSIRNMNFFMVKQTNIDSVKIDCLIIIKPFSFVRFNENNEEKFFIAENNIYIKSDFKGVDSGPNYKLLKRCTERDILGNINQIPNRAKNSEKTYIVGGHVMELELKNIMHLLYPKKLVFGHV